MDLARPWVHWTIYNIDGSISSIPENLGSSAIISDSALNFGATQGLNSFNQNTGVGYSGPCPPQGVTHNYEFTLLALDSWLNLPVGLSKDEIYARVKQNVIGISGFRATYAR